MQDLYRSRQRREISDLDIGEEFCFKLIWEEQISGAEEGFIGWEDRRGYVELAAVAHYWVQNYSLVSFNFPTRFGNRDLGEFLTPKKGPSFHASGELQIATNFADGFDGFSGRDVAGEEDVEVIEEGLLKAGVEVYYIFRGRFATFDLFVGGVIT
jgi:hypothetical protein